MKILYVARLHYPERLQAAIDAAPPDEPPPLFPENMSHHFVVKAMRQRGHEVEAFYRNESAFGGVGKTERHTAGITPGKVAGALLRRLPPTANPDYRVRNQRLIEHARRFQPDVLWMAGDNTVIFPETLATIKAETGCKAVYNCGTSPIVFSVPIDRAAARLYDMVLAADYYHGVQWLEMGSPFMEALPITACDPDFHRPPEMTNAERESLACDVVFVGTLVPENLYSRRVKALEALRDFDLGIWSVHDVPASLKPYVRGAVLGEDMLKVIAAAKLTVNVHGDFVLYGGNLRLWEASGVGTMQIADNLPGVREWFTEGETIVTFNNPADLHEKVAYYLQNDAEREAVAARAQAHVTANHTYAHRVARFEALLHGLDKS